MSVILTGLASFFISTAPVGQTLAQPEHPIQALSSTLSSVSTDNVEICFLKSISVTLSAAKKILLKLVKAPSKAILSKLLIYTPSVNL